MAFCSGRLEPRSRVLTDEELRQIWNSADALGYPIGPLFRLLILTGVRLNEGADAVWDEVDLKRSIWTIPARRMKGKIEHQVPITPMLRDVFDGLPRLKSGPFVFSMGDGSKALWVSDHHRGKVDLAARVYDWRNHDIRRTVRTHLSSIPNIPEHVRELMVAHKRAGIAAVYDRALYLDEKRAGLQAWHARLRAIVSGAPATNVVPIRRKRARAVAGESPMQVD